jgi:hypothetical protein
MKLFVLTALAGSFGVLGVAAWDATRVTETSKDLERVAAVPSPMKVETTLTPFESRLSKAEFASAAATSDWSMRTRDYRDLMFSARPMVTPPISEAQARPGNADLPSEPAVAVPAGAPVKAATERAKPAPARLPSEAARQVPDKDSLLMTPGRIARIKEALRLTPDQEAHWPPIEVALREIGKQQLDAQRRGQKLPTSALSPDVTQQLYWSAGPLIMSLRPDQKHEARSLARSMGLERVASLL